MSTEVVNGQDGRESQERDVEKSREEQSQPDAPFSWLHPHAIFVIILVGEEEIPFGIQKDFLCAKSSHYRSLFAEKTDDQLEHVVKLPTTTPEVFGLAQSFLYTGRVFSDSESLPGYEVLIATWKLGNDLGIDGLCEEALEAMTECRKATRHIPATPLLVKAWKETPEGSSIRKLLLTWAAEYIRSSESRSEFSKSLPQEVLSELVVAMSHLNSAPVIQVNPLSSLGNSSQRKNVHYLDGDESDGESQPKAPKQRHSDVMPSRPASNERKQAPKKTASRASLPPKPPKAKRSSINVAGDGNYSPNQKLNFCADLLNRMLSGPGFWTRLVGPFREPVRPVEDGVPDYFEKVTRPMDLGTVKAKMDAGEYGSDTEFVADIRQIFQNCYTYWTPNAAMWTTCEKFEKTFEEKYSLMPKWISKMEGEEAV
ncbi:Bromodomain-containing protein [Biscogniauxia marginata]|nr:Bromodomain-containing protein [Biscogniauxia marginata]